MEAKRKEFAEAAENFKAFLAAQQSAIDALNGAHFVSLCTDLPRGT